MTLMAEGPPLIGTSKIHGDDVHCSVGLLSNAPEFAGLSVP